MKGVYKMINENEVKEVLQDDNPTHTGEEIRQMLEEYQKLRDTLKAAGKLPKAVKKSKRADDPNYQNIIKVVLESEIINQATNYLDTLSKGSITEKKPDGNKWFIFNLKGKYSIAFLNNEIKPKKKEKTTEETQGN